jgi:hypothetical protein
MKHIPFVFALLLVCVEAAAAQPPNVVLILADDKCEQRTYQRSNRREWVVFGQKSALLELRRITGNSG